MKFFKTPKKKVLQNWFTVFDSVMHQSLCMGGPLSVLLCPPRSYSLPPPHPAAAQCLGGTCIYVARAHCIHATSCVNCMQRLSAYCANAPCLGRPRGRGMCSSTALCGTWRGACARAAGMFATACMRLFATTWRMRTEICGGVCPRTGCGSSLR